MNHSIDKDGNLHPEKPPPTWWDRHWLTVCLVLLFGWTTLGFFVVIHERNDRIEGSEKFALELRDGLVRSCDTSGNPLRTAVRGLLREQIKQSNPDVIARFFPQIPFEELRELVEQGNQKKREAIHALAPLNCDAVYPPKPDGDRKEP